MNFRSDCSQATIVYCVGANLANDEQRINTNLLGGDLGPIEEGEKDVQSQSTILRDPMYTNDFAVFDLGPTFLS